ncbi:ADP-forming succinate--CoA ligase subunit beta [Bacteroidetes/Chlorobi group bacterium Naka2016]|jgi:succinyl-CoA synthetase beta subunit|nr:MAG: ADP-forming succinate--CoA ligase subunit beta [Bacteroidetes/Chlorobi group bacterium Naka2016]
MKIHEYQAKELLRKFNVPVPFGRPVFTSEEAGRIAYNEFETQGKNLVVVKAQVFAGGRGKGIVYDPETNQPMMLFDKEVRGVNVVTGDNIADKVYQYAVKMLGKKLVTVQTGEAGTIIRKIYLEEGSSIAKEFYAGIVLDRNVGRNTIMVSTEGGVEIEKVAEELPEKILKEWINPAIGFQAYQARRLAFGLGLSGEAFKSFIYFITQLVKAYEELDCSLLEINPLVLTTDGKMIALDAKINFDDNALFRHPEYAELRDIAEEDPLEVEASKYDLNYIKLDGNVGCMVNGAGLAMATMDLIQLSGGKPANFLDVGGGANVERISNAFRIMVSDPNVKAVLINIFGGIVRCDKVANGIVEALKNVDVKVPVIVRLDGTNAEEGLNILRNSPLQFRVARTFEEAAKTVTEVVRSL